MTHPQNKSSEGTPPTGVLAAVELANQALRAQIGTMTRVEISTLAASLSERIESYLGTPVGDDQEDRELRRDAAYLLKATPEPGSPVFSMYSHMRALARVLRQVASPARMSANDDEGIPPCRPLGQPSGTYRVPSGLGTFDEEHWPSPATQGPQ